jgi:Tol biopolymer transport system component
LFDDPKKSSLAPVWSPRGDLIAFGLGVFFQTLASALRPPTEAFGPEATSQLASIRPDGTGLRVLASAGDHAGFPSWSPDQKRLVYVVSGKSEKGLRIIDLETEPSRSSPPDANTTIFRRGRRWAIESHSQATAAGIMRSIRLGRTGPI